MTGFLRRMMKTMLAFACALPGINNLGQIVGSGSHNEQPTAFLMTPVVP